MNATLHSAPALTPALTDVPVIETARLILRAPAPRDAERYVAAHIEERAAWVGGNAGAETAWRSFAMLAGHWILRGHGRWAVTHKDDDSCLGVVGCNFPEGWPEPEIAWFVFPEAEGQGIAREATLAALDHAWRILGWQSAVSYIHPDNARSIRLAERLGAVRDDAADRPMPELGTLVFRHPAPETAR